MDMDIDEIIEQIVDYLIENSEDIISLLEEKERNELADLTIKALEQHLLSEWGKMEAVL